MWSFWLGFDRFPFTGEQFKIHISLLMRFSVMPPPEKRIFLLFHHLITAPTGIIFHTVELSLAANLYLTFDLSFGVHMVHIRLGPFRLHLAA